MAKKIILSIIFIFGLTLAGCSYSSLTNPNANDKTEANINSEPAPPPPPEITLIFGGDVMLSRHVGTQIYRAGDPNLPWLKIAKEFKKADIAFVNLESPFSDKGAMVTEGMVFKAEPETVEGLKFAGIDIVSLANNHSRNQGNYGLQYSFNHLAENGIEYVGADTSFDLAHQGKVLEIEGIKFGFLAYTYDQEDNPGNQGINVNGLDIDQLKADLEDLKTRADVLIVSMHAGTEYTAQGNSQQVSFAQMAIDNGARLVIGHHPHWVQNYEQYEGGYIFYSLGNLIFDQGWSEATQIGLVVRVTFAGTEIKQIETAEVKIENLNQPRWSDVESDSDYTSERTEFNQVNWGDS